MPEGQHIHGIIGRFVAVQGDVAGITERDRKFTQLRRLEARPTYVRSRFQEEKLALDRLCGPLCRLRSLGGEKPPATLQTLRCPFRDNYSWHSGTTASSSVPQVFNQARTSSPVRCRLVS